MNEIINGSFWTVKHSADQAVGMPVFVQWLDADQWVLLSAPRLHQELDGGFYLANCMTHSVEGFPIIMTKQQIAAALEARFAVREHRFLDSNCSTPGRFLK